MSLFGSTTTTQQKPSLFGGFGNSTAAPQQQQPGGLFGSALNAQPQQQQSGSLFGGLGASQQQQQQQNQGGLLGGFQNQQQQNAGASLFGASQQQQQLSGSLWQQGSVRPGERSIQQQMQTLWNKWNAEDPNCSFQHYFYNTINPELVPYYGPNADEDPVKWDEALQKRPSEGSVPVLARGFMAVGQRLELQAQTLQTLHQRLHEINNALLALLAKHDLEITTRIAEAKRKHIAIGHRCLKLAAKVQVMRYKGYPLEGAEEELKKKLAVLEKAASDPALEGRSNEIWARMNNIRMRAAQLQEAGERIGKQMNATPDEKIDDATMAQIKKLLSDYDSQLNHLKKEVDRIRKDYEAWEEANKPVSNGTSSR